MSVDEESNYVHNSATGIVEVAKLLENTPIDNDGSSFHRIKKQSDMGYIRLMRNNRPFRLCLCSYLISHAGEWFTYVASIELLERILGAESSSSRVYIAIITICKQLPNFLLIPFSGVLADAKDKRQSMMFLDLCGAIPPILFLLASYNESISTVYLATLIQACIAALYEPCRASMVPLMVQEGDEMKIAITLMGVAWSACLAVGAALGGYMVAKIGINGCFVIDSVTFLFSWYLLQLVGGEWNSDASSKNKRPLSVWAQIKDMTVTGFRYIKSTTFWPLILIKPTTAIYQGGVYVLNVSFSEEDPSLSKEDISQRLGIIFLMVGIGCIVGPFITGYFNTTSNPRSILATCLLGYVIGGIGCLGLGYFEKSFAGVALFSIIRAIGSCATWVDYQVLIQVSVYMYISI
jgi:predicted MFS family arabinose efflux permease